MRLSLTTGEVKIASVIGTAPSSWSGVVTRRSGTLPEWRESYLYCSQLWAAETEAVRHSKQIKRNRPIVRRTVVNRAMFKEFMFTSHSLCSRSQFIDVGPTIGYVASFIRRRPGKIDLGDSKGLALVFIVAYHLPFRIGDQGLPRMGEDDEDAVLVGASPHHAEIQIAVHPISRIEYDSCALQSKRPSGLRPTTIRANHHAKGAEIRVIHVKMFAGGVFIVVRLEMQFVIHSHQCAAAVIYKCGIEHAVLGLACAAEDDPCLVLARPA